jgi:hypothetical protein
MMAASSANTCYSPRPAEPWRTLPSRPTLPCLNLFHQFIVQRHHRRPDGL